VVTGCFLTATATATTGASCPLMTVDPWNESLGDNDEALQNPLADSILALTDYEANVVMSNKRYTLNDGYVTLDRIAYPIPDLETPKITNFQGATATIWPPTMGYTFITQQDD
jgi:hypothetical protein